MTDRPGAPDAEPHLLEEDQDGVQDVLLKIPPLRHPPSDISTQPPEADEGSAARESSPMKHAPEWLQDVTERLDGFLERIGAVEEAVRLLSTALASDSGVPALRKGLVQDISRALASWVDPLLQDNAALKLSIEALDSRLKIAEGKIEELRRR